MESCGEETSRKRKRGPKGGGDQNLSGIVEYHRSLKRTFQKVNANSADEVARAWRECMSDQQALNRYAAEMVSSAEEKWSMHLPKFKWFLWKIWGHYFDGGLARLLLKDAKRKFFVENGTQLQGDDLERIVRSTESTAPKPSPVRILDVGSCYNPLTRVLEDFPKDIPAEVTAFDLCPAVPTVHTGDVLEIKVSPSGGIPSPDGPGDDGARLLELPAGHYHVVVFSLLLEYLPLSQQRMHAVLCAYNSLKTNGILLISTPESTSKHRLTEMKEWRITIEAYGFQRFSYEKVGRTHCMGFRKITPNPRTEPPADTPGLRVAVDKLDSKFKGD